MKLIDRYVTLSFLRNYVLSFCVLVGMYVVLDMVFNFDEFAEVRAKLPSMGAFLYYIGEFYFYQVFLYYVHLSGIIPVVAASFTLIRMIRFNEVSALLSAGVPLLRLGMPILIVALVLNALLWADQELLIPRITDKVTRSHDYAAATTDAFPINVLREEVPAGQMAEEQEEPRPGEVVDRTLFAARYFPNATPPYMEHVTVISSDANMLPVEKIRADRADWEPGKKRWKLTNGFKDINLTAPTAAPETLLQPHFKSTITPQEIQLHRSGSLIELLSTGQINELLKRPESYGGKGLLRVKHTRGPAQIMANVVLLLLALSAVLTREPQQLKTAAVRCIILCGLCLAGTFVAYQMAEHAPANPRLADKWPAILAWMPVFIFAPLAVLLLDRVKT